jgi:hypothetical protein
MIKFLYRSLRHSINAKKKTKNYTQSMAYATLKIKIFISLQDFMIQEEKTRKKKTRKALLTILSFSIVNSTSFKLIISRSTKKKIPCNMPIYLFFLSFYYYY